MTLEQKKKKARYSQRREIKALSGGDTADEVIDWLLGEEQGYSDHDYVLYKYDYNRGRTLMNRINTLWVYPVFILSIPFQWIITGDYGLTRDSKIGKIVDRLIKMDP
tara:strand:- start:20908 stop:21228 length:321 start_codon:yes stop_codon:yes gene_type:complete